LPPQLASGEERYPRTSGQLAVLPQAGEIVAGKSLAPSRRKDATAKLPASNNHRTVRGRPGETLAVLGLWRGCFRTQVGS
jgi:hypothetical protein